MCSLILFQSEVRLAEDHDVYISKAQLDSILVNYTRSGSLLFRKLVQINTFLRTNSLAPLIVVNLYSHEASLVIYILLKTQTSNNLLQ